MSAPFADPREIDVPAAEAVGRASATTAMRKKIRDGELLEESLRLNEGKGETLVVRFRQPSTF